MAQNKLDKEFRDKLNLREINPTPAAWDRLDAMLAVAEEKKSKKSYGWMYVAAACLVVLLVGSMFFKQSAVKQPTDEIEIVEQQVEKSIHDDAIINEPSVAPVETQVAEAVQSTSVSPKKKVRLVSGSPTRAVAAVTHKNEEHHQSTAANADVEKLLASAMMPTHYSTASVKVDPNALLSQVDGEIELSFREKVIKSAGKNFQNVKVALANRNLE